MLAASYGEITRTGRVKHYPDGSQELLVCSKPIFREDGWEARQSRKKAPASAGAGDVKRAQRRARSEVRDLALCNPFTHFVTLTLDGSRVDRYDMAGITRKLNAWLSNQVQRRGLKYILVPERHKDGAIHFHGFFNDVLERYDGGTVIPPGGGKPRKPRTKAQRAAWLAQGGRVVWNLPGWALGFTTALELMGEYPKAVSYVCKYIGKQQDGKPGEKIGGRWYYSGGDLARPNVELADLDWRQAAELPGAYTFQVPEAGALFVIVREGPPGPANEGGTSGGDVWADGESGHGGPEREHLTVSGL